MAIKVTDVKRPEGIAVQAKISTGNVEITFIRGESGQPKEIGRMSENQILDDQALIVSPADYKKMIETAGAILGKPR